MGEAIRVFALHNRSGSIVTLITGPADGPPATVAGEADQVISEVSLTGSAIDLSEFENEERAMEILAQCRIEDGKIVRGNSQAD